MGRDYSLELSTGMSRSQALSLLKEHLQELQWTEGNAFLRSADTIVTVIELDGVAQAIMEEGFGFRPNLSVGFRFPSNHEYTNFVQTMLRGTLLMLSHGQDGVLLFNGEKIVLQRIGGQLVFNADYHLHGDEHWLESMVPVPFVRRPLPSPFL
jgi:hypothetical protein